MKILVACEYSGKVRDAMRRRGHEAVSCDLLPTDTPGPHYQGDVFDIIHGAYLSKNGEVFEYGLGKYGVPSKSKFIEWDMMIGFPPCTYVCASGLHWNNKVPGRRKKTNQAVQFFKRLLSVEIPHIALENPVGCLSTYVRKPDQMIQPYQFGDDASKKTCLWLKNLPPLKPTKYIEPRIIDGKPRWGNQTDSGQNNLLPSEDRWKIRSKTYTGIAEAMAKQWGGKPTTYQSELFGRACT